MVPLGKVTAEEMKFKDFGEQAMALAEGGADGIVIETMTDLAEAKVALRAAKENTNLPVAVTMTFDKGKRDYATIMGIRPEQAARELEKDGADIVGANCGAGIDNMIEVVGSMRGAASLPIWCKPNAGLPELLGGKPFIERQPEMMASQIESPGKAGADIIGGCCGTTPAHIQAFVRERDRFIFSPKNHKSDLFKFLRRSRKSLPVSLSQRGGGLFLESPIKNYTTHPYPFQGDEGGMADFSKETKVLPKNFSWKGERADEP